MNTSYFRSTKIGKNHALTITNRYENFYSEPNVYTESTRVPTLSYTDELDVIYSRDAPEKVALGHWTFQRTLAAADIFKMNLSCSLDKTMGSPKFAYGCVVVLTENFYLNLLSNFQTRPHLKINKCIYEHLLGNRSDTRPINVFRMVVRKTDIEILVRKSNLTQDTFGVVVIISHCKYKLYSSVELFDKCFHVMMRAKNYDPLYFSTRIGIIAGSPDYSSIVCYDNI